MISSQRTLRIALAAVLWLVAATSWAATFTYAVDDTLSLEPPGAGPNVLATGTITTSGLGALSASDIVDFAITLSVPGQVEQTITQGPGAIFSISGDLSIEATESQLQITFGASGRSDIQFQDPTTLAGYFLTGEPQVGSAIVSGQIIFSPIGPVLGRGLDLGPLPATQTYARIVDAPAPIPLPPAAFLLLGGIGALGLVKRRRA